jgi:hypothetical protein
LSTLLTLPGRLRDEDAGRYLKLNSSSLSSLHLLVDHNARTQDDDGPSRP